MLQSAEPTATETDNFLSGHGIVIRGAAWTSSPANEGGTKDALGIGFFTPQFGGSYNYTFDSRIFNKK